MFINQRNEFVVILYNKDYVSDLGKENEVQKESNKDLLEFCKKPRTRKEIAEYLDIETIFYAMKNYVQPLVDSGELELTIPEKPKSRNQKFVVPIKK